MQGRRIKALRQMHGRGKLVVESRGAMAKRDAGWGQTGRVEEGLTVVRMGFWTGGGCADCCPGGLWGGLEWRHSVGCVELQNMLFEHLVQIFFIKSTII